MDSPIDQAAIFHNQRNEGRCTGREGERGKRGKRGEEFGVRS
jgi:hypothetical protein